MLHTIEVVICAVCVFGGLACLSRSIYSLIRALQHRRPGVGRLEACGRFLTGVADAYSPIGVSYRRQALVLFVVFAVLWVIGIMAGLLSGIIEPIKE